MKNEIINFIMGILHNNWSKDWSYESAKNFCKRILDNEGIDYQEEDFHIYGFVYDEKKTPEIVKKYAEMYRDAYQNNDQEKTKEMEKIIAGCNRIKKMDDYLYNELHDIFNGTTKDSEPEKDITIKMKNEIINFIMGMLHNNWSKDLSYESAKNFCKRILDNEGIDYQEENFHTIGFVYDKKRTNEIVKKYAEMYRDAYQNNDQEKTKEMEKIIAGCNKIKKMDDDFDNLYNELHDTFNDTPKDSEPEKDITIKRGESIHLSNGVYSNVSPDEFEKLMNIAFPEEKREEPFTINFSITVPKELREEVINRVTPILEEARSKMENGKVK